MKSISEPVLSLNKQYLALSLYEGKEDNRLSHLAVLNMRENTVAWLFEYQPVEWQVEMLPGVRIANGLPFWQGMWLSATMVVCGFLKQTVQERIIKKERQELQDGAKTATGYISVTKTHMVSWMYKVGRLLSVNGIHSPIYDLWDQIHFWNDDLRAWFADFGLGGIDL